MKVERGGIQRGCVVAVRLVRVYKEGNAAGSKAGGHSVSVTFVHKRHSGMVYRGVLIIHIICVLVVVYSRRAEIL